MEINIKGRIVSNDGKDFCDFYGIESTCPNDVINKLKKANGKDVEVYINSPGGSVFAGSEIYTALKNYNGKLTINIVGLAGSAASVIAMAGKSKISPTGLLMIHNVSTIISGDYKTLEKEVENLKVANQAVANAYIQKTGLDSEKILDLMDKESWFNAEQCVELGFINEIMFTDNSSKVTNEFISSAEQENESRIIINSIEQERLNLLKIGGFKNEF